MKNLMNYFSKNKKKLGIIGELKKSNSEVRIILDNYSYLGWIKENTRNEIVLLPYLSWENLPKEKGSFLTRVKLEQEIGIPLPVDKAKIEKLTNGYILEFALMQNYFSLKDHKERSQLFSNYPFPNNELVDIIEGKTFKKNYSEGKIGFK